jgi:hypothetical protein
VIYPGSTPVGNATLVVANVLTCNKHSPHIYICIGLWGWHLVLIAIVQANCLYMTLTSTAYMRLQDQP